MPHPAPGDWPENRVVARLPGSLPMGGVVQGTPVHAFAALPAAHAWPSDHGRIPRRHDIDLGGLTAFVIDDVITAEEADSLIAASEHFGFRDEAPGIATPPGMRMNMSVHWLADDVLMTTLFERIADLLPEQVDGAKLHPQLSRRLNVYRYRQGDTFNLHVDGDWAGYGLSEDRREMVEWPGVRSRLSLLLYLNGTEDGIVGGNTRLYRHDRRFEEVSPKKGSALFFRHGMGPGSVLHEGRPVVGPVAKYVARINVLYEDGPDTGARIMHRFD